MDKLLLLGLVLSALVSCTPFEYGEHSLYPSARARPHSSGRIDESAVLGITDEIHLRQQPIEFGGTMGVVPMPENE